MIGPLVYGDGDRRILLLHGISSNANGWWRLGPDLAAAGFTVVAPDLRAHGRSPAVTDYSIEAYRDDVLGLGSGWDVVLGHSLGGSIAVVCQATDPGWARSLVLEDPALVLVSTPEVMQWLLQDYRSPIDIETIRAAYPEWHPNDVTAKVEALRQAGPHVVEPTMQAFEAVDL